MADEKSSPVSIDGMLISDSRIRIRAPAHTTSRHCHGAQIDDDTACGGVMGRDLFYIICSHTDDRLRLISQTTDCYTATGIYSPSRSDTGMLTISIKSKHQLINTIPIVAIVTHVGSINRIQC